MLLMLASAHPTIMREQHPNLGRLAIPRDCSRIDETAAAGVPWAADNFAFSNFDAEKYRAMLARVKGVPGCKFVAVPDVVGDAPATRARWDDWLPECKASGQPLAFVAQDGVVDSEVPWGEMGALFLGGSDDFKLGPAARQLVAEAKKRGLWVHMGRVNTARRFRYAASIGCDSVDGTQFSRWRKVWLKVGLAWAAAPPQLELAWP